MIKPIQYEAVNWVDGMKISQKHLETQTNFILDGLRDVRASMNPVFSYGLLPLVTINQAVGSFDSFVTIIGDMELALQKCNAITPSGCRVELANFRFNLKPLIPRLDEALQNQRRTYYLIITINPFDKIPHGTIDVEENPPRYPYVKASCQLEFIPVSVFDRNESNNRGDYVIIGKVTIVGEELEQEDTYIPPCSSVLSHPVLLSQYNRTAQLIPSLKKYALKILQKEINTQQNAKLAKHVKMLCQTIIHDIGTVYFHFRNVVPHLPPLYFIGCFSQIAAHLHQVTQTLSPPDLEELLNYISEWSEIAPHTFLHQLTNVAEIRYQHLDCETPIQDIQTMLCCLEKIFLRLNELDYIGQRKENIIVNEVEVTPMSKSNRGWSVLD